MYDPYSTRYYADDDDYNDYNGNDYCGTSEYELKNKIDDLLDDITTLNEQSKTIQRFIKDLPNQVVQDWHYHNFTSTLDYLHRVISTRSIPRNICNLTVTAIRDEKEKKIFTEIKINCTQNYTFKDLAEQIAILENNTFIPVLDKSIDKKHIIHETNVTESLLYKIQKYENSNCIDIISNYDINIIPDLSDTMYWTHHKEVPNKILYVFPYNVKYDICGTMNFINGYRVQGLITNNFAFTVWEQFRFDITNENIYKIILP
jgi:hypothetical protein